VDATFWEQMILGLQAGPTGSIVQEEVRDERTCATGQARVDARRTALGTEVLSLVSDRAQAVMPLAAPGWECLRRPAFLPLVPERVKRAALARGRRLRHAQPALQHAEQVRARLQGWPQAGPDTLEARALGGARPAAGTRWEEGHHPSRGHCETRSLPLHPLGMADAVPQTSGQVEGQLQAAVEALEAFARDHQLPARPDAMTKVRKQLPALAALVDCWWQGLRQDLEPCRLAPRWRQWVHACLLPMVYWDSQGARTRCRRRTAKRRQAVEEVRTVCERHPITQRLALHVLAAWQAWATDRINSVPRTSSAVEGRHGALAQLHRNQRGVPKRRSKVWTVLHNFDCRASDGTTPAARFCRRGFPDLFETV